MEEGLEGSRQDKVILDGFESLEPICTIEEEGGARSLEQKYGQFAQDSWEDWELSLKKMGIVKSDLKDGLIHQGLMRLLAIELKVLAISKEELT